MSLALGATGTADPALADMTVAEGLEGGKFENLNRVLSRGGADGAGLAAGDRRRRAPTQPLPRPLHRPVRALRPRPGAARADASLPLGLEVARRRPASLVRETRFVEIGPVTAFGRRARERLLPFPELRFGWGLDLHWAAVAAQPGWRLGVVDAVPVRHESRLVAAGYAPEDAVDEAARFLAERPYLPASSAGDVVAVHRRG